MTNNDLQIIIDCLPKKERQSAAVKTSDKKDNALWNYHPGFCVNGLVKFASITS